MIEEILNGITLGAAIGCLLMSALLIRETRRTRRLNALLLRKLYIGGETPPELALWGMELSYAMPELVAAMKPGRPVQ